MNKCPQCSSANTAEIQVPAGYDQLLLAAYNSKSNEVNPGTGIPVNAWGCKDCKAVFLKSPKL